MGAGKRSEHDWVKPVCRPEDTPVGSLASIPTGTEAKLEEEADKEKMIELVRTHPGVGPLTSLALIHTVGDVRRFRRKEEVVAFIGLDPLEKSSGETKRMGQISKRGSRLVRHLLGQAAQSCRDIKIRQFYSQVSRRRGRPKAKVAAARTLLINCARLSS